MSFFYLTAVKGDIPAHLLEKIAFERLSFLKLNQLCYNEYMVEGSIYDNVGHFLMCVVTIICKNIDFNRFLLKTERNLFTRRLEALNAYELRSFAKKLLRTIKKQQHTPEFIDALKVLCEHLLLKDLAQHICLPVHENNCIDHIISLNFKHCLPFIATRQVVLNNGVAFVPCGKWKQFLIMLFCTNLSHRLQTSNLEPLKTDPRIIELLDKLRGEVSSLLGNDYNLKVLLSKEVNNASLLFPPCMVNLHQQLRKKHRLSHTQRFYYSLFLKDIGMPVEESVTFWRGEYQQSPNGNHSCCHNWEKDEKKYLYGIRHMYGLEGCRKNYASVNCQRIQSIDNSCSEGGCPFKTFEPTKMLNILNMDSADPLWLQINELKSRSRYTSACMKYLQSKCPDNATNCDINNSSFNFTPVKYYVNALTQNNVR